MMNFRKIIFSFSFLFSTILLSAEIVTSDIFGYSIDLPEGFELLDMTEDQAIVQFSQKNFPATVLLCVYPLSKYKTSEIALSQSLSKLGANAKAAGVRWRRLPCASCEFSIDDKNGSFGGEKQHGLGAAFPLAAKKSVLVAISLVPEKNWKEFGCAAKSALDSIYLDAGSFKEPGIFSSNDIAQKTPIPISIEIDGEKIESQIFKEDKAAQNALIDREFDLLCIYVKNNLPEAISAWQRFYRMIMRDTLGRTRRLSFDISVVLSSKAQEKDSKNPTAAVAAMLLSWSQDLKYSRKSNSPDKADFADFVSVLRNEGSDCDSRSLLLAVILKNLGVNSCIFVSAEYSHAILGVAFDDKLGQKIEVDGVKYLVGDTTKKGATLGLLAANQMDRSKWVPVEFPF